LYYLGIYNQIVKGLDLHCDEDLEALKKARALACTAEMEMWQGTRLVARIKPGDAQPTDNLARILQ
jgi:hypothetical protein